MPLTPSLRRIGFVLATAVLVAACGPSFDRNDVLVIAGDQPAPGQVVTDGGVGGGAGDPGPLASDAASDPDSIGGGSGTTGTTTGGTVSSGGAGTTGSSAGTGSTGSTGGSTGGASTGGGTTGGATTTTGTAGSGGSVAPGPQPGITDETIKIGYLVPITGAAPIPTQWEDGARFFWTYLSDHGGVNGRKVVLEIYDTESSTSTAVNQAKKAITQDGMFTIITLDRLEVQKAVADFMESANYPHIMIQSPANPPSSWRNTFTISIDHVVQGRAIAQFFAKDLGAAGGAKKVGFVREETNALKPGTDAFEAQAAALGLEVVARETINAGQQEFSQLVLKLKNSGAEIVWLYMAPTPAANIITTAAGSSYRPTWFANSISWNFELMNRVAAAGISGAYAFSPWKPLGDPAADEFKQAWRSTKGSEPDEFGLVGWAIGEVAAAALAAPGPQLGHDSFRAALKTFKIDTGLWAPVDFNGRGSLGSTAVSVWRSDGDKWQAQGNFRTFQ